MNNKSAIKTVSMMVLISLVGKALGLFRDMQTAYFFGTDTIESIAFTTASVLPRVFLDIAFASVITAGFIPIFNECIEKKGKDEAFKLSNNFVNIIILISTLVVIFGMVFARELTFLSQAGLDSTTRDLATELLRIMLPIIIFSGVAFTLTGILQSFDEFNIPSAMSIVSNSIIILYFFFLCDRFSVYGLAVAFTLGWFLQILIQIPTIRKFGYRYKFFIDFKDENIKKMSKLMLPVMISTWAVPINYLFNYNMASLIDGGTSAVALNIAYTFYNIVAGVIILSISNLILPKLSKLSVNNDVKDFGLSINKTVKSLFYILIPMSVGMMLLGKEIITLFYQRGEFDIDSTKLATVALIFYSVGIVGYGLQNTLSRAFYSMKDGKTPLVTSLVSIGINMVFTLILYKKMEIGGIALASSISITIIGIALFVILCRKNEYVFSFDIITDLVKNIVSVIVMAVVVIFVKNTLGTFLEDNFISRLLLVGVPTVFGVLVYYFMTLILKVEESLLVKNMILRK